MGGYPILEQGPLLLGCHLSNGGGPLLEDNESGIFEVDRTSLGLIT